MTTGLVIYHSVGIAAIFVAAVLAFVIARRRGLEVPRWVFIGMVVIVPPFLLTAQLLKYASLHMYADFSHWLNLFFNLIETGRPWSLSAEFNIPGYLNYFSAHFVPLVYFLAIPFALFPFPQTLLILNVAFMSSAAIPLYLLVQHRTGDKRFALCVAALLLWYPTFQYITLYEFEMLRFSIPILFWMLYAWERQRIGWYYALVILATFVREEVGLTVGMFGLYLFVFQRRRTHGMVTFAIGFTAFAAITHLIMPAFRNGERFVYVAAGMFGVPGSTPLEVVGNLLWHPFTALATIAHPMKIANLGMLGMPLLGIPFLVPSAFLPALPTFAIVFLSGAMVHSSYMLYYIAPAVPFLFYAFLKAWPRLTAWLALRHPSSQYVSNFVRRIPLRGNGQIIASAVMVAAFSGLIVSNIFFGPSFLSLQFWSDRFRPAPFRTQSFHWSTYRVTDHHRAAREIVARIPEDAIVSTQQFLMPRLASRRGVMTFPQLVSADGHYRAEYVLFDRTNNGLRTESPAFVSDEAMDIVRTDPEHWALIQRRDAYALYRLRP